MLLPFFRWQSVAATHPRKGVELWHYIHVATFPSVQKAPQLSRSTSFAVPHPIHEAPLRRPEFARTTASNTPPSWVLGSAVGVWPGVGPAPLARVSKPHHERGVAPLRT